MAVTWLANVETGFSFLTIGAINGVSKYTNTVKPYLIHTGRAKVYIADASIQISNTANVYKIVKSFSLEDAWIKGSVMILNSFFIMCEGLLINVSDEKILGVKREDMYLLIW